MLPLTDGTGTGKLLDKLSSIFGEIPRNVEGGGIPAPSLRQDLGCDDDFKLITS